MKNTIILLAFVCITLVSMNAVAFPDKITKDFEVGPGTANPQSHSRFFHYPSRKNIIAGVRFERQGPAGKSFDLPLIIELRQPGNGNDADGPLVERREVTATTSPQEFSFSGNGNNMGCSGSPWKVRFIYVEDNNSTNNFAVLGRATVWIPGSRNTEVNVEGGLISLNKGNGVTKTVATSSGVGQGEFKVYGTWYHSIGGVPGPLPVKLKFDLIKPNGSIAESKTAYRRNEPNGNPDMFFTYHVLSTTSGQWKLRITNNSDHDVMNIDPKVYLDPGCFEQ